MAAALGGEGGGESEESEPTPDVDNSEHFGRGGSDNVTFLKTNQWPDKSR